MPIPPSPLLRESLSPGDTGHISDHEAIHEALNNDVAGFPPSANATIQYVGAWGNDAGNGLSVSTPKLTVLAAYDALPAAGGRIECLGDVTWGGAVVGQGLWIDGRGGALAAGWRAQKRVTIVGVGGTAFAQHQYAPGVYINGHSATDVTKPPVWLCGVGSFKSIRFENIYCTNCARGPRIGTLPDGSSPTGYNLGVEMDNCGFEVVQSPGFGPGFTFDGGTTGNFWMNFTRMFVRGNRTEAIGSDLRAAVVATGRNYLVYLHDWRTHGGGGYRLYGADRTFFDIRRLLMEGGEAPATADPPVIEVLGGTGTIKGIFEDISSDDAHITVGADIVIPVGNGYDITVGRSGKVIGRYKSMDDGTAGVGGAGTGGTTKHPAAYGAIGQFGRRMIGQTEAGKRLFAGVSARAANVARFRTQDWTGRSHGTYPATNDATLTHGRTGPHGLATAARINGIAGASWSLTEIANAAISLAVGDVVVWGAWVRAASSAGYGSDSFQPSQCTLVTTGFTFDTGSKVTRFFRGAPDFDGTEQVWQWWWGVGKVGAVGINPCAVTVSLNSSFGFDVDALPGLLAVLPVAQNPTIAEATEFAEHANAWMPGVAVGDVSLYRDQGLVLGNAGKLKGSDGANTPDVLFGRGGVNNWRVGDIGLGNSLSIYGIDGAADMLQLNPQNHIDQYLRAGVNTSGGGNPKAVLNGSHGMWLQHAAVTMLELSTVTGAKLGLSTAQLAGMHGAAVAQQTVAGSRGGNAALADLLTKLVAKGIIADGTSA